MMQLLCRIAAKMKARRRRVAVVFIGWALLATPFLFRDSMPQLFVKNLTASMPVGLYLILPDTEPKDGDIVSFVPPEEVTKLALERGWIKEKVNFLKTVGALPGDTYTITDWAIYINGTYVGSVYSVDGQDRPMPELRGTFVVQDGYFLPISTYRPRSFDGRYIGEVPLSSVRHRVVPFFTGSILEVLKQ